LERPIKFVDSASCHFIYQEIFEQEIYKFQTTNVRPYIIDAGANIGLSVIYFKKLFPAAIITAFEPDPKVYNTLCDNIKTFGFQDVVCLNKALWDKETVLDFYTEGADAGRVSIADDKEKLTRVFTVSLRNYIKDKKVDFLKIDIEGAETTVIKDCGDLLQNVDRLFVEYHSFAGQDQTLPELLSILKASGFRLNITRPGLPIKSPFLRVEAYNGMDMQLNIYATRLPNII
jgi:FkbM family methyltransferase